MQRQSSVVACTWSHFCFLLLYALQDMDDMDADLFASKKKPSSAPAPTKKDSSTLESKVKPEGAGKFSAECSRINYFLIISFTLLPALKFALIAANQRESCVCLHLSSQMNPPPQEEGGSQTLHLRLRHRTTRRSSPSLVGEPLCSSDTELYITQRLFSVALFFSNCCIHLDSGGGDDDEGVGQTPYTKG